MNFDFRTLRQASPPTAPVDTTNTNSHPSFANGPNCVHPKNHAALRLALRPQAFFSQLLHLTQPRLIVRAPGLTLCRETEFGVFFREPGSPQPWLADPVSGLAIAPNQVAGIYFVQAGDSLVAASFEIELAESGFVVAVQATSTTDSLAVRRICRTFGEESIDPASLRASGACAWLDEEIDTQIAPTGWQARQNTCPLVEIDRTSAGKIEVCPNGPGYGIAATVKPNFFDHDGELVRIADAGHHNVVFASASLLEAAAVSAPDEGE